MYSGMRNAAAADRGAVSGPSNCCLAAGAIEKPV
jgi:hypothetical protein